MHRPTADSKKAVGTSAVITETTWKYFVSSCDFAKRKLSLDLTEPSIDAFGLNRRQLDRNSGNGGSGIGHALKRTESPLEKGAIPVYANFIEEGLKRTLKQFSRIS